MKGDEADLKTIEDLKGFFKPYGKLSVTSNVTRDYKKKDKRAEINQIRLDIECFKPEDSDFLHSQIIGK